MRLFVAVNLPPQQRQAIEAAVAPLRSSHFPLRWVEADALHLTLKFLGEVPEDEVAGIRAAIDALAPACPRFPVHISGLGAFPNLKRPRVLWVGIDAPPALPELQRAVELAMADLGFAPETRPFSPHLTVARARNEARAGDFPDLPDRAAGIRIDTRFDATSVDLMRSHLGPRGARYERLHAAPLG